MSAGPRHRGKGYRAERIEKMNEFSREEMLIGTDGMEVLARSQVAVFGLGGVGSHAAEARPGAAWESFSLPTMIPSP